MSSYLREVSERYGESSLPSIRRSGALDSRNRCRITTLDTDISGGTEERHVRFTSAPAFDRDSPVFYPRPPSPTQVRRHDTSHTLQSNQDEIRLLREDLAKKDRLIQQLSSVDTPRSVRTLDTTRIDEIYAPDRISASAACKSELTTLQVKVDGLSSQVRELQTQVDIRENRIRELKMELETVKETEGKHLALVHKLREQITKYEVQADDLEGAAARGNVAVQALQKRNNEAQEKIIELESRLRTYTSEREEFDRKLMAAEMKYKDLFVKVGSVVHIDDVTCSMDILMQKISDVIEENSNLRGKIYAMKEYVGHAETENKASRETIMRLVSEAEREQKVSTKYTYEVETLRVERDTAVAQRVDLEKEIVLLKERLESSARALKATRQELEVREGRFREIQEKEHEIKAAEAQLKVFKEQIAALLSDGYVQIEPYEENIRERIRQLHRITKDREAQIGVLEGKMRHLSEQLDKQYELQKAADRRAQRAEADVADVEHILRKTEGELAAGDALRDGMRMDKEKYLHFLTDVSKALKMELVQMDSIDIADAILARIEQLTRMECDSVTERQTTIYNLQRKVKGYKEQLDSKEVHMDLLRKKVASLEERLLNRSDLEKERDAETQRNKKLIKLVEKYKKELAEYNLEIRDLKARLLMSSDIKARSMETEKELEHLEGKLGQLEKIKEKQAHKIAALKEEVDIREQDMSGKKEITNNTIQALTSELRTTKQALAEITERERTLLDLRQVIARMLGLDVNLLAVPDYEIISRLEKLILAQQSHTATTVALDTALDDMGDGFRAGYQNATKVLGPRSNSLTRASRTGRLRTRSRSMSPSRKNKDTRVY